MKKLIITTIVIAVSAISVFAQGENLFSDFDKAKLINNQKTIVFDRVGDAGDNAKEIMGASCLNDANFETHSTWIRFRIKDKGTLSFDITPLKSGDDYDFVVFRVINNTGDKKEEIRCMAAGAVIGTPEVSQSCQGITGLRTNSSDKAENRGCASNKDNFLAPIVTVEGEEYAICINNFASKEGFMINFTGTANFENSNSESPSFTVSECSPNPTRQETIINISTPTIGNTEYVVYSSNGIVVEQKQISLIKGSNNIEINAANLAQGAYKVALRIEGKLFERTFIKQ